MSWDVDEKEFYETFAEIESDRGIEDAKLWAWSALDWTQEELRKKEEGAKGERAAIVALEQQNIVLLRWQAVASDAHIDHLCNIIRALAVADETPRVLRDLSAAGVEEEVRRAFAAERINREKSESFAREWRKKAENAEALTAEVERLRAEALEREERTARIMLEAERHRRIADEAVERIESAETERAALVAWLRESGEHREEKE